MQNRMMISLAIMSSKQLLDHIDLFYQTTNYIAGDMTLNCFYFVGIIAFEGKFH